MPDWSKNGLLFKSSFILSFFSPCKFSQCLHRQGQLHDWELDASSKLAVRLLQQCNVEKETCSRGVWLYLSHVLPPCGDFTRVGSLNEYLLLWGCDSSSINFIKSFAQCIHTKAFLGQSWQSLGPYFKRNGTQLGQRISSGTASENPVTIYCC